MAACEGASPRRVERRFLLGVLLVALVSCGESTAAPESPVASVDITPPDVDLMVGDTVRMAAVARSSRGEVLHGRTMTWSSNRPDLASVDEAGLVTARKAGTAAIVAATGGRSATAPVRIVSVPPAPVDSVTSVDVEPTEVAMEIGDTVRLSAVARADDGSVVPGRTFAWASDRVDIASVSASGLVMAHASGRAVITASTGAHAGSTAVEVAVPPTATPQITLLSPSTIQAGWGAFTLTVTGLDISPQARVTWNGVPLESFYVSSTEIRATVSSTYVVSEGSAEVRVETPMPDQRTSNALVFTIFAKPAFSVDLLLSGNATSVGDQLRLRAVARDQFGAVIEGKKITWTSSDTTVARIEGDVLRGLKIGSVQLVAEAYPTFSGTLVHVVEAPVAQIGFEALPTGSPELFRRSLEPPGPVLRMFAPGTYARQLVSSPDGTRIAFVGLDAQSNQDIYVANIDGSGVARLTTDPAVDDQPAWSPDGERIAFRSFRQGKSDVWTMNADGSGATNLTFASAFIPEEYNADPAWSPDGETLVFSRGFGVSQALYKVGRDGSGLTPFVEWTGMDLVEPAWHEDDLIAFRRVDRGGGGGGIEFVSGSTGELIYFFWPLPASSQTPLFVGNGWVAVSALAHPESTLPTIAFYHLSMGYVLVPMGPEFGRLREPAVLAR